MVFFSTFTTPARGPSAFPRGSLLEGGRLMKKVLVPLAEGCEEIEAITVIDVLRRADVDVTTCYLSKNPVKGAHGVCIAADRSLEGIHGADFDMICLPGGMPGSAHLKEDSRIVALVRQIEAKGGYVAAICAAPIVLGHAGVLHHKKATCYPGFEHELTGAVYTAQGVVADGRIITANGPGSALPFALKLVEALSGGATAGMLREQMQAV